MHLATGQQVQVQVIDSLAPMCVAVDHAAVTVFGEAFALGESGGGEYQLADQFRVAIFEIVQRGNRACAE